MVSKIENGQISASLSTLQTIAEALKIPLGVLFKEYDSGEECVAVKAGDGTLVQQRGTMFGHIYQLLGQLKGTGLAFEPYIVELTDKSEMTQSFQHTGVEFLYLLEGSLIYIHAGEQYPLEEGDSLVFDARSPHGPFEIISSPCRLLSVSSHPKGE